jgi:tetratricopeptide (TPR) repeat protein
MYCMDNSGLTTAFKRYADELVALEKAGGSPPESQVLRVLLARDAVQTNLDPNHQDMPNTALQLVGLDSRLKKMAVVIAKSVDLKEWNTSLKPPPQSWWWAFENNGGFLGKFNWLWGVLTAIAMTFAISLAVDISSRLVQGTPDTVGTFALITQGLILALSTGGVITKFGRDTVDKALANLSVPSQLWNALKAILAVLLFMVVGIFHLSLPRIAIIYNNIALSMQQKGQYVNALAYYKKAVALNPNYPAAYYNQGLINEDLQDYKTAITQYRLAMAGGLDAAYNNLARLDIINLAYGDAAALLIRGLDVVKDDRAKYDMLKNLAWARIGQLRFSEAETQARSAISLDGSRAPGYCLLAQALEGEGDKNAALQPWNDCLKYASSHNPDEDLWIGMARTRLEANGGTP